MSKLAARRSFVGTSVGGGISIGGPAYPAICSVKHARISDLSVEVGLVAL